MDVYQNFVILHGGIMEVTQELNDMYAFDTKYNCWSRVFKQAKHTYRPVVPYKDPFYVPPKKANLC